MKKPRQFSALTGLISGLAAILFFAEQAMAQALGTTHYCKVTVKPEVEIFSVVDYLGRGKRDMSLPSDYKTAVEAQFRQFQKHPAIKYWQTLQKKHNLLPGDAGLMFSAEQGRFLLSADAGKSGKATIKPAEWQQLEEHISSFAAKSGFQDFHEANKSRYQQWQNELQTAIDDKSYHYKLLTFMGSKKSFEVHPDPLDAWGTYQVSGQNPGKVLLVWGYAKNPDKSAAGPPHFADSAMLNNTLWHEMAHTYIHPLVMQQAAELKKLPATDKVRRNASRYYELTPEVAINELLVRGMVASLTRQHFGDAAAEREIKRQLKTFGYDIAETERLLSQNYLKNRGKFPTIESFFPVLIAQFEAQP